MNVAAMNAAIKAIQDDGMIRLPVTYLYEQDGEIVSANRKPHKTTHVVVPRVGQPLLMTWHEANEWSPGAYTSAAWAFNEGEAR